MSILIDRRLNSGKKNTVNRRRFIQRHHAHIKKTVINAANKRAITEIDQGESITIPAGDISEPLFQAGPGGHIEKILPGNDRFNAGDQINRTQKNAENDKNGDGGASNSPETGNDDFVFELSREEFLELYFDDLELPDLVKKEFLQIKTFKTMRAGITTSGTPTNINILRSMRQAAGRRIALSAKYKRQLRDSEKELKALKECATPDQVNISRLQRDIEFLTKKIHAVPFIDKIDLRYNNHLRVHTPATQAVMFCIMDVSGSMDEIKKDIAKRFFILLYLFLTKNYEKIELIFIRHHTSAKEVVEQDFFHSRETGGTVVSSSLELLNSIIEARYPSSAWNIYVAQASDGDNWNADSPYCVELLNNNILPKIQYYAYIEILPRHHQSLWELYQQLASTNSNFSMKNIDTVADIYPVFRELFARNAI